MNWKKTDQTGNTMTSSAIGATANQTNETLRTITEDMLMFKNKGRELPSRLRQIKNFLRWGTLTSCSSFSNFSCSSTKYLEVTRAFWDLSRQSLASSTSWCWMNPSTPSARGRAVPGEHSAMMSSSWPSIWAVAWETTKMEDFMLTLGQQ